ncbi:cupin domain-containing protein [Streptomyces sp. NPDC001389]|uniref:cupin domain-containing protein n=1 Tax=Streptomyces sp. NPDC001389 TaxID=3364569 RepID=UPI0036C098FB
MTHPHPAGVPTDLDTVIAEAPAGATGALWRLTGSGRALDSNLIRLRPGAAIAEHAEPLLDVLLLVVSGGGRLDTPDGTHPLRAHSACWLPRGTRRSLTAGPDGLAYLTVHTRRPGLGIGSAAPTPAEGGEPACLLHRVCPACGRLAAESAARYCSRCGTELPE